MRVRISVGAALLVIVAMLAACDDDDDPPTQTNTPAVAASPTQASATPDTTMTVPAIAIDSPAAGTSVSTPIDLSGTANTFEAALTVDVLDAAGDELCVRHIMATSGSGTPGTWSTTLGIPPPDVDASVTLRAYELSARDGSIINLVEREVMLSTERPSLFITSPVCGATVAPGATLLVEGAGVVFEAAFNLELRDASGAVVVTEQGMAGGTEELPFSVSIVVPADAPDGMYDLAAFSYSAADGTVENEFLVQIVVES